MAARWLEHVRIGEFGCCRSRPEGSLAKERILAKDQTWILASDDPERMKFEVRSTTREVTGCKCDAVVATCLPVHVYQNPPVSFILKSIGEGKQSIPPTRSNGHLLSPALRCHHSYPPQLQDCVSVPEKELLLPDSLSPGCTHGQLPFPIELQKHATDSLPDNCPLSSSS